jgi:ribosomal protein S18 acetylase RimI-like enzyme
LLEIKLVKKEDVNQVSRLISLLNNTDESHIGYCGNNGEEIANSLINDISDVKYTESFIAAYDKNQLVGVLGFDADLDNYSAEVWGPFIKDNYWEVCHSLWSEMNLLLPSDINSLSMFPNKKNSNVLKLANNLGFSKQSDQTILTFQRNRKSQLKDVEMMELTKEYFTDMIQLHDLAFPCTYYTGKQILERLNDHRKVFMLTTQDGLSGYIYVEADPEFGEGNIEFFAVKVSERGKGLGEQLLIVALNWLFTFQTTESITLCVNSSNDNAIRLYKKVGFKQLHELCYFTKVIDK